MKNERYEYLAEKFLSAINNNVEYQEEHVDSGESYAHLIREGDWQYHNGDERLKVWLKNHEFSIPENWDSFTDEVIDWCKYKPSNIYQTNEDDFVVSSFLIGEIEDQYCWEDLQRLLPCTNGELREFVSLVKNDNRFCLTVYESNNTYDIYAYTSTDACWLFYIDKEFVLGLT